jgi:hypothetical protein
MAGKIVIAEAVRDAAIAAYCLGRADAERTPAGDGELDALVARLRNFQALITFDECQTAANSIDRLRAKISNYEQGERRELLAQIEQFRESYREAIQHTLKIGRVISLDLDGNMTQLQIDRVSGEDVYVRESLRRADAGREDTTVVDALRELFSWVKNWSPSFTEDGEWPATEAKVKAALAARTSQHEGMGGEGEGGRAHK